MSVQMFPQVAWAVTLANLREVCPAEVAAVEATSVSWNTIARWKEEGGGIEEAILAYDDVLGCEGELPSGLGAKVIQAVESLEGAFESKTELGLAFVPYDEDESGADLDVPEGCIFSVTGTHRWTPAGERFKDKINEVRWTIVA